MAVMLAGVGLLALIVGAVMAGTLQPVAATILGSLVVMFLIAHSRYVKQGVPDVPREPS